MSEEERRERRVPSLALACVSTDFCYVGRDFIDVESENIVKRNWSSSAPDWRKACDGLNLEGYCTNSSCKAYNQSRVIHEWGYGTFDFFEQGHLCTCPLCGKHIEAETCGFTNCEWKASGRKRVANDKPPIDVPGKWRHAPSDGYITFEENVKIVRWDKLVIEARKK
ncbi:hypothetical protein EV426DRAFT_625163 [Tirmania nivea]|nr:hypothetical protein EV426DRAFT_625163 [Tirmania nivea]